MELKNKHFFFFGRGKRYTSSNWKDYVSEGDIEEELLKRDILKINPSKKIAQAVIGYTVPKKRKIVTFGDRIEEIIEGYDFNYPEEIFIGSTDKKYDAYGNTYFTKGLADFLKEPKNSNVVVCYFDDGFYSDFPDYLEKMLQEDFGINFGKLRSKKIPGNCGYHVNLENKAISIFGYEQIFIQEGAGHIGLPKKVWAKKYGENKKAIGKISMHSDGTSWSDYDYGGRPHTWQGFTLYEDEKEKDLGEGI